LPNRYFLIAAKSSSVRADISDRSVMVILIVSMNAGRISNGPNEKPVIFTNGAAVNGRRRSRPDAIRADTRRLSDHPSMRTRRQQQRIAGEVFSAGRVLERKMRLTRFRYASLTML
jgi:hypothetical protein